MTKESLLQQEYDRSRFTQANQDVWDSLAQIKGESFVNYRKLIKKAEAGELLTDFPVELLIKTTLNCNHYCPRCPHGMGIFPRGKEYNLSFDTLRKVLDEGATKGLQSVVFTGGEPTMHPQFVEFLEYTGAKKFPDISIVTNGSMLSPKIVDAIISHGVTRINISFDSITPKTYEKVRGVNHYDKVLKNIDALLTRRKALSSKTPLLSLSFVLSEDNADELDGFVEMWQDKADGGIKIYPYKDVYSIVDDKFVEAYGVGRHKPSDFKKDSFPTTLSHENVILSDYKIKCAIPWYRSHLGIRGEIQACTTLGFCDHPLMVMGNINDITFEAAWKSDRWQRLRELTISGRYDEHPVCKVCQASI